MKHNITKNERIIRVVVAVALAALICLMKWPLWLLIIPALALITAGCGYCPLFSKDRCKIEGGKTCCGGHCKNHEKKADAKNDSDVEEVASEKNEDLSPEDGMHQMEKSDSEEKKEV